jgi:hypothetical protein
VVADACEGVDVEPWHIEDRSLRKESGGPTLEAGQELITEDFRVKRAIRGAFEGATVPDSGRSDGGGLRDNGWAIYGGPGISLSGTLHSIWAPVTSFQAFRLPSCALA